MILELFITNVGKAAATDIQIVMLDKLKNGVPVYFDTGFPLTDNVSHSVDDYFSDYFALPTNSVSISIKENKSFNDDLQVKAEDKLHLYKLNFKIRFSDVMENFYEQEFYIIYDYEFGRKMLQTISKNSRSYPPKLINN
ncbi:hypothetical protein [Streptococcus pluranimalium]|uniref:hypothetical protein n=1 Tax=Streptococcus pluranimalium TaxID=82348 RepID=UPI004046E062